MEAEGAKDQKRLDMQEAIRQDIAGGRLRLPTMHEARMLQLGTLAEELHVEETPRPPSRTRKETPRPPPRTPTAKPCPLSPSPSPRDS